MTCKKNKGFTLTEVLVVVLVIGIIAAIAYPVYLKAINKSRAVEAVNLIEIVKNKQIANFARKADYLTDFKNIGQLTGDKASEQITSDSRVMKVGKYELALNTDSHCISASYIPSKGKAALFTFSTAYDASGLGCDGDICSSFGNIVGAASSVCNCKNECGPGFTSDPKTCTCNCSLECNSGGVCKSKTQAQITSQSCGNGGTQTRSCTPSCDGGSCGSWGPCEGQTCGAQPASSRSCGNCGVESATVTCNGTTAQWNVAWSGQCIGQGACSPGETKACGTNGKQTCSSSCGWGSCVENSIECPASSKPSTTRACGVKCGQETGTVSCDTATGKWGSVLWSGKCTNEGVCAPNEKASCDSNGTKTCTASCTWGACEANKVCEEGQTRGSTKCNYCGTRTTEKCTGNAWIASQGDCSKSLVECLPYKPEQVNVGILADCHNTYRYTDGKQTACYRNAKKYFIGGKLPYVAAGGGCTVHYAYYNGGMWWEGGEYLGDYISNCSGTNYQSMCDTNCAGKTSCSYKCLISETVPSTCGVYKCSNGKHCDNSSGSGTIMRCKPNFSY